MRYRKISLIKKGYAIVMTGIILSTMLGIPVQSNGKERVSNISIEKINGTDVYAGEDGQPYVPFWYPEDMLTWNPSKDKSIVYNISSVPLAKRVADDRLSKSNETQSKDTKVVGITIMNSSTSGNPSQGSNTIDAQTFSYWQYLDTLVYWGGSAGEGIIVPPGADVTDAAHRNGVPVLGTVFFPQVEHGGKIEWIDEFLTKDKFGAYPMGDKLIEVARTMKFDGWFINQETQGTSKEDAKSFQELVQYCKKKAPELEIMWYDSMTKDGSMDWQNALTDENQMFLIDQEQKPVADSMFLNFWWTNKNYVDQELLKKSKEKAELLGISNHDLYAGIDIQAEGTNTPIRWDLLSDGVNTFTSIGLYCPSWTYFSSKNVDEYMEKENRLWVNELGDPSLPTKAVDKEWRGISTYVIENSPITSLPFYTNFSMGNGLAYYNNGKKVSNTQWNNRSVQDVQPTYRYIIENTGRNELKAKVDYSTAYNGGNSMLLSGVMEKGKSSIISLYSGDTLIENNTKAVVTGKSAGVDSKVDLVLEFHDGKKAVIKGSKPLKQQWTEISYDLKAYKNKHIEKISLSFTSNKDSDKAKINLGNIRISNDKTTSLNPIKGIKVKAVYSKDGINGGVALYLGKPLKELRHYEIYRITDTGKEFVGVTTNNNYYVNNIKRQGQEDITKLEVVGVDYNGKRSKPAMCQFKWGSYPKPVADFSMNSTLIAPKESITFNNLSSETTKSIKWIFEGGNIKTSTKKNPVVTYEKPGIYSVTLIAKNSSGEDRKVKTNTIVVDEAAHVITSSLALNQKTNATSQVSDKEAAKFAVDELINTKWCAVGNGPHAITINLNKPVTVSEIRIAHAGAGGENKDFNTKAYTIETSMDGITYEKVLQVTDNKNDNTIDPIKPTTAQYIKLKIDQASQGSDSATRIYDIKVVGIDGVLEALNNK